MTNKIDPFEGAEPVVRELYDLLLARLKTLGPYKAQTKRTSIHLTRRAAFLGVHPKKRCLEINVVSSSPLDESRGYKVEAVSRNRFHNRIRIERAADLNAELMRDIKTAYQLME